MSQTNSSYNRYNEEEEYDQFQCRHIFTGGRRCGSPSLRNENFCYFHHTNRKPVENAAARKARLGNFDFTWPEDRAALQLSLCQVLERIASNDLDPRRAGLLLYGLQIASQNLPPLRQTKNEQEIIVDEVVQDEVHGPLAPRATIEDLRPMGPAERLLAKLRREGNDDRDKAKYVDPDDENYVDPYVIPTVEAVAAEASAAPSLSPKPCTLNPALKSKVLVHKRNRHTALANAARNALDRVVPHVARAKNSRQIRLQRKRLTPHVAVVLPSKIPGAQVAAGPQIPKLVPLQLLRQP
jgi:hypothetical protein